MIFSNTIWKVKSKTIKVVPHRPEWAEQFVSFRNQYESLLDDLIIGVEHVGSTAVPGLWAKPKIDIDIIVASFDELELIVERLASIGYKHRGNLGVPLREAFKYIGEAQLPAHNLYVCADHSESLLNHLHVRDHLVANPQAAAEYGRLKCALAEKYPTDIDSYIEGKTDFLVGILKQYGFNQAALDSITVVNKKKT